MILALCLMIYISIKAIFNPLHKVVIAMSSLSLEKKVLAALGTAEETSVTSEKIATNSEEPYY
ncbi:MAG: hypothetical protein V7784_02595 [Oceanospirillaceae bacterium]